MAPSSGVLPFKLQGSGKVAALFGCAPNQPLRAAPAPGKSTTEVAIIYRVFINVGSRLADRIK